MGGGPSNMRDGDGSGKFFPSNATGCFSNGCKNPLSKTTDEHLNKTVSKFNASNTDIIKANQKNINDIKINCSNIASQAEISDLSIKYGALPLFTSGSLAPVICANPEFCSAKATTNINQDAVSKQNLVVNNVGSYNPVNNLNDTTNIASVVSNSTSFIDSSILGNSDGPHNQQTLASVDLKGKDISNQTANFINLVNVNACQTAGNILTLNANPLYSGVAVLPTDAGKSDVCGVYDINQHSAANQSISVTSDISNNSKLDDAHQMGITVDADNKQTTDHENTNLNKLADTAGGVIDHTVDGIAGVLDTGMDDMEHGAMGAMILPCIGFAIICAVIGLVVYRLHKIGTTDAAKDYMNKAAEGIGQAGQFGMESARNIGSTFVGAVRGITPRAFKERRTQSGGGFKTLSNTLDTIKLSNEQLIMIITIILLLYNIYT